MRNQLKLATVLAVALALGASASAFQAAPTAKPNAAATRPATPQAPGTDYLVRVGKHTMWKSQVAAMHPELVATAKPLSRKAGTDYLVQVGKTPVLASTLRRVDGPDSTRPSPHASGCKDYLVQSGKKTVWASEVGAPCLAGPHKGERRPLCCVMAMETGKDLMPCCKEAQGK